MGAMQIVRAYEMLKNIRSVGKKSITSHVIEQL
jgi:hypothetical protein